MGDQMLLWSPPRRQRAEKTAVMLLLEQYRADLIDAGQRIALAIAEERGRVTSPEVLERMEEDPELAAMLAVADRRFMGGVFCRGTWRRVGWEPTGSKGRPVAVWAVKS